MAEHQEGGIKINFKRTGVQDRVAFSDSGMLPILNISLPVGSQDAAPLGPLCIKPLQVCDTSCLRYGAEL